MCDSRFQLLALLLTLSLSLSLPLSLPFFLSLLFFLFLFLVSCIFIPSLRYDNTVEGHNQNKHTWHSNICVDTLHSKAFSWWPFLVCCCWCWCWCWCRLVSPCFDVTCCSLCLPCPVFVPAATRRKFSLLSLTVSACCLCYVLLFLFTWVRLWWPSPFFPSSPSVLLFCLTKGLFYCFLLLCEGFSLLCVLYLIALVSSLLVSAGCHVSLWGEGLYPNTRLISSCN